MRTLHKNFEKLHIETLLSRFYITINVGNISQNFGGSRKNIGNLSIFRVQLQHTKKIFITSNFLEELSIRSHIRIKADHNPSQKQWNFCLLKYLRNVLPDSSKNISSFIHTLPRNHFSSYNTKSIKSIIVYDLISKELYPLKCKGNVKKKR